MTGWKNLSRNTEVTHSPEHHYGILGHHTPAEGQYDQYFIGREIKAQARSGVSLHVPLGAHS